MVRSSRGVFSPFTTAKHYEALLHRRGFSFLVVSRKVVQLQLAYLDRIPLPVRLGPGTTLRSNVLELLKWVEAVRPSPVVLVPGLLRLPVYFRPDLGVDRVQGNAGVRTLHALRRFHRDGAGRVHLDRRGEIESSEQVPQRK